MADVDLLIGGRNYSIACRDGGEEHLRTLARHVDRKATEARAAVGDMNEARQMLFAALLIADEMAEASAAIPGAAPDPKVTQALIGLADRIETVAGTLEARG